MTEEDIKGLDDIVKNDKVTDEDKDRIVANVRHPIIDACVNEMFRLKDIDQAIHRLKNISKNFIISKNQEEPENKEDFSVRLWIKGFAVNGTERKSGYLGNFAVLKFRKTSDDKYTIYAVKELIELNNHPQKKRNQEKHPNWGHPLLREIKKKSIYETSDDPQNIFMALHEEFPEVSIPCTNKLYLMVYSRKDGNKNPKVEKYVFTIHPNKKGGGYYIDYRENMYKPKQAYKPKVTAEGSDKEQKPDQKGYFTSMVNLKRNKKK